MSDENQKPEGGQNPTPRPTGIQTGILSSRIAPPADAPIPGPAASRQPTEAQPAPPVQPPAPPAPPRPITPPDPSRWSVRGALWTGLIAIVVLLGGFTVWAMESRISGAVVASGQVEVEQQRQIVQHPDGGVVEEILVKDGQTVEAGQPLIRLDGSLLQTEHAIVEGQYFEILARRGRLEAERADAETMEIPQELLTAAEGDADLQALIEGQRSLFDTRRDTLRQSIEQLEKQSEQVRQQVEGIDAQIVALNRQRELIGEELEDQQSLLDRGLAQASRVLALEREAASLDGQVGELKASRAAAETRQTELDIQRLRLGAERREEAETELRDLGYRELELAERRRSLTEQISRLDIRAPAAGVIYNMQVTTPRSVVRPADPVLYVIPQDRPLVVSARLATINVDEVQAGQPVVLRFSAFSSRTTPEIDGVLGRVSADALMDEATRMPYYRAEVTIPAEQLEKLGDLALIPGMPVEVFIQTGERSPMAYLVKPLADYFNRAFRES
ncbi:HlyD family type I secretion periplasmic adaptor subunit [Paracoccus sp. WLY502]|uniref:HlyD family type I secretion periplasmic adaptor subunit n=1 Tax=Paracoccus yibinensis TaxID=3068891 RepID=UPI0027965E4B|nr:HlyD family type I secretion periplasmic adaptor subunit [Paracoccus sp. WLY502]MDQ1900802.1 HlyD family type I secretion periplasmic adaptor subunit [Paracoccus sp. WLY502]